MDQPKVSASAKDSGEENAVPDFSPLFPPEKTSTDSEGREIKIGTVIAVFDFAGKSSSVEVFTMTLGNETIELLPQKNWTQLDRHKWSAQGKLPGTPSGLEIGLDQVHFAGQTLSPRDPEAREKLEGLLNNWLSSQTELTRKKASTQLPVTAPPPPPQPDPTVLRFSVEVDKRGQVHVHCIQDKQTLASIGLSTPGFNSLIQQGFMRKPRVLHIGVLHDWLELDGERFSFENSSNDASRLEQILNERYLPSETSSRGKEVLVLVNAASATGFDIQFPATVGGVPGIHRQHLDEQSLELLQDKQRCGLLHNEIIIKIIAPNIILKRRTPEGGEQYFARHPDNIVTFTDEDGRQKQIDLSQPVNFMHITAPEFTAVFNHPSVSRHSNSSRLQASLPVEPAPRPQTSPVQRLTASPSGTAPKPQTSKKQVMRPSIAIASAAIVRPIKKVSDTPKVLPNLWLKEPLSKAPVRHEWLAPLVYRKLGRHFENSSEGLFGQSPCWFISLDRETDIAAPAFKGILLTEKGGLGFLSQGQIARFNNGVGFVGKAEAAHEGIGANLVATGVSVRNQVAFIMADNYRSKFELSEETLVEILKQLNEAGAAIMSISELLDEREPMQVMWTLPAEQEDPNNPQVVELRPPESY